ncbi:MAG: hypothetical protein AAAFM81_02565 [Pseudomonadota bacterium]
MMGVSAHHMRVGLGVALLIALTSCRSEPALKPFSSDGCSLFPDASPLSQKDWCACCFEHDIAYWKGGTREEREAADLALKDCVAKRTGNQALAGTMYEGVRAGGSPYFYNWYRWGYGWPYARKYQALTDAEQQEAARLLAIWEPSERAKACPDNLRRDDTPQP